MGLSSLLRPRTLLNPMSRLALATFAWKNRHEILRWGRSLYEQLIHQHDLSPGRAALVGRVLYAVAGDDELRNAPELRQVSLRGDVVELDVDKRWTALPRLIERVQRVKGVRSVVVEGSEAAAQHAVFPAPVPA